MSKLRDKYDLDRGIGMLDREVISKLVDVNKKEWTLFWNDLTVGELSWMSMLGLIVLMHSSS